MVKPIVCEFKNYFVRFDFINCNKFGEIGVFTDYMEVDKINNIKNKLDNYHKEFGNFGILYAIAMIYRVYKGEIKNYAFKKEYNFVHPKEKIPKKYINLINKKVADENHKIDDMEKQEIIKDAFDILKDKNFVQFGTDKTFQYHEPNQVRRNLESVIRRLRYK